MESPLPRNKIGNVNGANTEDEREKKIRPLIPAMHVSNCAYINIFIFVIEDSRRAQIGGDGRSCKSDK